MGTFNKAMQKYLVLFLALVSFHGFNLTHGRKISIKPLNKSIENNNPHPFPTLPTTPSSNKHKRTPNNGVGHKKEYNFFMKTMVTVQRPNNVEGSTNGVGPGPSPSIGHKKSNRKDNIMKSSMVAVQSNQDANNSSKVSVVNGVGPGHSPGVGHKKLAKKNDKVSINGVGPGPSPGDGH